MRARGMGPPRVDSAPRETAGFAPMGQRRGDAKWPARDRVGPLDGRERIVGQSVDVDEAVPRRVDADGSLSPVPVPGRILNEIRTHALESRPEECCGLIIGNENERFVRVERCRNEMTQKHTEEPQLYPRDGKAAFYMSASDVLRVEKELRDTGERVSAVYHSHVGAGAYLSKIDLEYAEHAFFPFPDAYQIVIEVKGPEDAVGEIGIFQRKWQGCIIGPVEV